MKTRTQAEKICLTIVLFSLLVLLILPLAGCSFLDDSPPVQKTVENGIFQGASASQEDSKCGVLYTEGKSQCVYITVKENDKTLKAATTEDTSKCKNGMVISFLFEQRDSNKNIGIGSGITCSALTPTPTPMPVVK